MDTHKLLFAIAAFAVAATGAVIACSSGGTAQSPPGPDATPDMGVTVFETSPRGDSPFVLPDGPGFEGGNHGDGGLPDGDSGVVDAQTVPVDGPLAACSLVNGACDIVSQNCSSGSECAVVLGADGGLTTTCLADTPSEHLPVGAACCPTSDGTNPCDPGLECNGGNTCTPDAGAPGPGLPPGWGGSRCTPRCCPSDGGSNHANCGTAGDGGTQGSCNLDITYTSGGPTEYAVCTYPDTCVPLGISRCISGFGCEVDQTGTSTCTVIYNPNGDAGATTGQACQYANQGADGLVCISTAGSTASNCAWMCRMAGAATPFDAGLLGTTPGTGGCPTGKTCGGVTGFPAWLGACN